MSGGRLTTHVLDISTGRPGAGVRVELWSLGSGGPLERQRLREVETNSDGRLDGPLLQGDEMKPGRYELIFHVGSYYRGVRGDAGADASERASAPVFLEEVPVRFGIGEACEHYHVPLLIAPGGYSTYRGS